MIELFYMIRNFATNSALIVFSLGVLGLIGTYTIYLRRPLVGELASPNPTWLTPAIVATSTPTPSVELPPLYSDLEWKAPIAGTYSFVNPTGETVELKGYRIESELLIVYPRYFIDYYIYELATKGWTEIFATSSRSTSEYVGFEKDGCLLIVGVVPLRSETGYHALIQYTAQKCDDHLPRNSDL